MIMSWLIFLLAVLQLVTSPTWLTTTGALLALGGLFVASIREADSEVTQHEVDYLKDALEQIRRGRPRSTTPPPVVIDMEPIPRPPLLPREHRDTIPVNQKRGAE